MILNKIRALRKSKLVISLVVILLLIFALSRTFRSFITDQFNAVNSELEATNENNTYPSDLSGLTLSDELISKASTIAVKNPEIPYKVISVLVYIRAYNQAPEAYVGGDRFYNREGLLPNRSVQRKKIKYLKWDVNPRISGVNRGAERLVTSTESAYYTADHYRSFVKIFE